MIVSSSRYRAAETPRWEGQRSRRCPLVRAIQTSRVQRSIKDCSKVKGNLTPRMPVAGLPRARVSDSPPLLYFGEPNTNSGGVVLVEENNAGLLKRGLNSHQS